MGVTAHGLGHLTRVCPLADALCALEPRLDLSFWTALPRERIASEVAIDFEHHEVPFEPGTVQRTAFELDRERTVERYVRELEDLEARCAALAEALSAARVEAVVCDVPAVLCRAAGDAGIPVVAVSNFTWDWILEPLLAGTPAEPVLDWMRDAYGRGAHHLRLPFGPESSPFPHSEPGPLISRRATLGPAEVRRRLGLPAVAQRPLVLVCPGGWDATGWGPIEPDTAEFDLLLVGDLPVRQRAGDVGLPHALPEGLRFPDLVAAADVVLAKPGYGIASECVNHRTPLVSIERPGFREAPLLEAALAGMGPGGHLSLADFHAGRWRDALEVALSSRTPWVSPESEPAQVAAERVLAWIEDARPR